jgi:hypothetical protein
MALTFYPHSDDVQKGSLNERIEVLMEAAERYKAIILDSTVLPDTSGEIKRMVPRELKAVYNWEEISRVLREIRELSETDKNEKIKKGNLLARLSEVYEVLRAAKMSKLEAVRLALISEATQLGGSTSRVA